MKMEKLFFMYPNGQYKYKKFSNWSHIQVVPFWITLDFEAFNIPYENPEPQQNTKKKYFIKRIIH